MIVVDASVLATALGDDGPDGDRARARLRGERLSAPELLDLEVASVLRRQVQGGEVDIRRAALALADLAALPLRRAPHRPLLARCWELRDNLTVYDASYVALAEALDVTLLTGDRRLARAPGPRCRIEMLRSASLSAAFASFLACRDEVCRITVCLACGSRSSEPRDRASWTLAPSVHQADIDHGTWSSRRGDQHAYPPFGTPRTMTVRLVADIQNRLFWRVGSGRASECCIHSAGWSQASREGASRPVCRSAVPLARSLLDRTPQLCRI